MKITNVKNIMVYVELNKKFPIASAIEILGKAREIADKHNEEVLAVVMEEIDDVVKEKIIFAGADKILILDNNESEFQRDRSILSQLIKKYTPRIVIFSATLYGKDMTASLTEIFETISSSDVEDINITDNGLVVTTPVYGGTILNDVKLENFPIILNVRGGSFDKVFDSNRKGEVIIEKFNAEESDIIAKIINVIKEATEAVNIEDADIIVAGGRGMGSKENFELVKDLAKVCGGVIGATRPATEEEWVPRFYQIGQSGKIVSPKLYIACGISGAIQHSSGMNKSGYIVAINKDEDAPIFEIADVGIVGDVTKILPLLIKKVSELKNSN